MRTGREFWVGITFIACFAVLLLLLPPHKSATAETAVSPWLSSALPILDRLEDLGPNEPLTPNNTGNQSCQQREVITRPKRLLPIPQSKQSHTSCVVDTGYGAFSTSNYLQRQGSTVAGNILTANGGSTIPVPIPYSSTGLTMGGGTFYGYYLFFWDNLDKSLDSTALNDGKVVHKLPATSPVSLRDKSGRLLAAAHESMSFSTNGDWMVVDIPFVATVRVNTKTREVLPFGTAVNYSIGLGPGFRTAISPDGKYAIVASNNFGILRLYDLSTCGPVPNIITTKVSCSSRDLLPFIQQQVTGFTNVSSVRFRSDYTLDMYLGSKIGTTSKISRYTLTADGQQAASFQYLALGDSFASGEGAYQYKALTDTTENKCHLSQRSYPYLISSELGFGQYESMACSGAKIQDITDLSELYNQKFSQAKNKEDKSFDDEILAGFLPGYRGQKRFLEEYQPSIITLSAVGNDIGFADKIKRCLYTDTCYSSYEDRLEIVDEINRQFPRLTDLYTQIKNAGDPRAKIYVVGYPQIAYPDGNCANNVHLNRTELIFANQLVSYLNSVVKTAASNVGVAYVDTEDALAGHKLCETDSWNVAINGLTTGNDIANIPFVHGPIGNESYHPNALGQSLLKAKILEQTANFTLAMPTPNSSLTPADPPDSLPILSVPKTNRTMRIIKNTTGTNGGAIELGKTWVTEYSGLASLIKASSTVRGWLNSDPVDLGTFNTDASGNVTIQITLAGSVPTGFHTLHLYGKNTSDEDVDIYETVYVSGDNPGACVVVPTSAEDTDKDSTDDACDPLIDQPPLVIEPIPTPSIEIDPSVGDPKPPANNPETEAGPNQEVTEPTQTQGAVAAANTELQPASSPTNPNNLSATPQVQGLSTNPTPETTEQTIPTTTSNVYKTHDNPWLKALYVLLSVATAAVIVKVIHHPK